MNTVYPDNNEITFRKKKYKAIGDILNNKIECGICNSDLLNEIISKKKIMVHKSHLILCCLNCFFKLCEGSEFTCILCNSNIELSNCKKCIHNICKRCVDNYNIEQVSNGILPNCFGCSPQMLWDSRAVAANVLKIFYSQLDIPNGLLVNETEHEQTVRKYLLKEAKIGRNSETDLIKDRLCMDFILNSYKPNVIESLLNFAPKMDNSVPISECSKQFIQICEHVIEKTCLALTNCKRILTIDSQLSPGVSAIMKSLLKTFDEDTVNDAVCNGNVENAVSANNSDQLLNDTKMPENEENSNETMNDTNANQSSITRSSIPKSKENCDDNVLEPINASNNQIASSLQSMECWVVLHRLNDSEISKYKGKKYDGTNFKMNDIDHPLELFGDLSDEEEKNTRKLRNRKILQNNTKRKKEQKKKSENKIVLSEDEKENDRLTNLNNIKASKTKKVEADDDSNDDHSDNNLIIDVDKDSNSIKSLKVSKNEVDKMKIVNETIENIDETDSDSEGDSHSEKYCSQSKTDIFNQIQITAMDLECSSEASSGESGDSSLSDVLDEVLSICNKRKKEYYIKKYQDNQSDIDEKKTVESDHNTSSDLCAEDDLCATTQRKLSPLNLPSVTSDSSDDDLNTEKNRKGKKRKCSSSNSSNNSDSSSKYFKRTPAKQTRSKKKSSVSDVSNSSNSDSSNSDNRTSLLKPTKKRKKRCILSSSNESIDESNDSEKSMSSTPMKGRKNIRRLKRKTELSQQTLNALKDEESRKKRIEERQKLYNKMFNAPKAVGTCKKLVLDFDPKTKKELVSVHPDVAKFLKPHQVEGIKFLWNSVFESLAQIKISKGSGSIVAHCMGLGKTLQIIALVHTLFRYQETGIKTVLIITPRATIENWCNEFSKWLDDIPDNNFSVLNLNDSKTYVSRNRIIKQWQGEGGVLITSYTMFRQIVACKTIKKFPEILKGLVDPGPNLIVCDEGHILKNQNSIISKTVSKVKTLRRIVLTGTPLQNNLQEYHCMVDFIRPNLLGSLKDFTNRFVNPITNGQYSDSTPFDVKLMKRRSHVLHRMLEGFVQRFDFSVLTPFLPPKHEYVIYLKLADKQKELYRHYLDNYRQPGLFTNYNILQMIWTHPKLLKVYADRMENEKEKQKLKELDASIINDDSTSCSDSNSNSVEEIENVQVPVPESTRAEFNLEWWKPLMTNKDLDAVFPYSKFIMMFSILQECEEMGDKVILFSQSLNTLDIIQEFLENAEDIADDKGGPYGRSWTQGQDFFRIDGSVNGKVREDCCQQFNDVNNTQLRLLLLSTKAFNLGINLVGANRVIVFDVTWNPSLNVQSIFRIFRFGQIKPCYIYRLISEGTMEQKIYERQISKLSLSFRVVDEHQIDRHFNARDQEELYEFEPSTEPKSLNLPKDRLMCDLILKHKELVIDILEHDSLLQNNEAEELDENDRNAAWEDYEKEKADVYNRIQTNSLIEENIRVNFPNVQMNNNPYLPTNHPNSSNANNYVLQNQRSTGPIITNPNDQNLYIHLQNLFPQAPPLHINEMLKIVKQQQRQLQQ